MPEEQSLKSKTDAFVREVRNKEIAENAIRYARLWREESDGAPDIYRVVMTETDLLFIEDALINKVNQLLVDLERSINKIGFPTEGEPWAEDAAFLADSIYRITQIISQGQWLRNHPDETESYL